MRRNLGILDTSHGAGVLALHSHAVGAFLDVGGSGRRPGSQPSHRRRRDEVTKIIIDLIDVPFRLCTKMLQRIRGDRAALFGDGPAFCGPDPRTFRLSIHLHDASTRTG